MILDVTGQKTYPLSGSQKVGSDRTLGWWDNSISSIKVGKRVKVKLCRYQNCKNEKDKPENAVTLVGPYASVDMGWAQDYTSTIVVTPFNEATEPVVSFFGGDYFNCDTGTVLPVGNYNSRQLRLNGIDPYEIRGFKVPAGLVLEIFDNDFQSGKDAYIQGAAGTSG